MILVDLAEKPNDALLERFYNDLILPAFPCPDELDDLNDWRVGLQNGQRRDACVDGSLETDVSNDMPHPLEPELHVVIALDEGGQVDRLEEGVGYPQCEQMGGAVYEWYPGPLGGTALLSYLVTSPGHRKRGVARALIANTSATLEKKGVHVFIAETHKMNVSDGTDMDPKQRHKVFYQLGFSPIRLDYSQPPVRVENRHSDDLILIAHRDLLLNARETVESKHGSGEEISTAERAGARLGDTGGGPKGVPRMSIPSCMLHSYIDGFCGSVFGFEQRHLFEKEAWYIKMAEQLDAAPDLDVLCDLLPPWDNAEILM